jgi:hypothetical protein
VVLVRRIWYRYIYLPKQIAKYVSCMPHSLHRKFVEFLKKKSIICVESYTDHIKCPFCGYTFSKKGFEKHLIEAHYDTLLQLIDEYFLSTQP